MGTILTLAALKPKSLAVRSLRPKCPWVLHHIVTLSSDCHSAVAECGSMYPWCTGLVWNSRSATASASSNPWAVSPTLNSMWLATLLFFPSGLSPYPPSRYRGFARVCSRSWIIGASSFIAS